MAANQELVQKTVKLEKSLITAIEQDAASKHLTRHGGFSTLIRQILWAHYVDEAKLQFEKAAASKAG